MLVWYACDGLVGLEDLLGHANVDVHAGFHIES